MLTQTACAELRTRDPKDLPSNALTTDEMVELFETYAGQDRFCDAIKQLYKDYAAGDDDDDPGNLWRYRILSAISALEELL